MNNTMRIASRYLIYTHSWSRLSSTAITTASATGTSSVNAISDYTPFLSESALKRQPSPIRALIPISQSPGMISLAAGLPNPSLFPFKSFSFGVLSKEAVVHNHHNHNANNNNPNHASDSEEDGDEVECLSLTAAELNQALQYSETPGIPQLIEYLKYYHSTKHCLNYDSDRDWDLLISTGSQDLIIRAIDTILNDSATEHHTESDTIIVESPTYSGVLAYLHSKKYNILNIDIDEHGMRPELLEHALQTQFIATQRRLPRLLYTIPVGQNPSGMTYTLQRKREIYAIASKYNMLIFEDDPYRELHFGDGDGNGNDTGASADAVSRSSAMDSFQSIDIEGRVIRSDSFSKVLSSGLRIGYITGPSKILDCIQLNMQATHLHTSGLSQMMIYKLLTYYELDVFNLHLQNVSRFYKGKRDTMQYYLTHYFGDGDGGGDAKTKQQMQMQTQNKNETENKNCVVEWNVPMAGMFYWLKLSKRNIEILDTGSLINEEAIHAKVLLLPGKVFYPLNDPRSQQCSYVRASFSIAGEPQIKEGLNRFAQLLQN